MALAVTQIFVGGFDENLAYLISNTATKEAFIVDPSGDIDKLYGELETQGLTLVGILVTHTHHDHIERLADVLALYTGLPIYVHEAGKDRLGVMGPSEVRTVVDGDTIMLGGTPIAVMYTPGHIDDAVCFSIAPEHSIDGAPHLITGDTLFVEGCGRTNEAQVRDLYDSLQRLKGLSARTIIYPGHDYGSTPTSTIKEEKKRNKYLRAKDFREFKKLRLG